MGGLVSNRNANLDNAHSAGDGYAGRDVSRQRNGGTGRTVQGADCHRHLAAHPRGADDAGLQAAFARYPDAASLADAPVDELQRLLRGSGYPEVKAPRIKEIARILRDQFGGQVPKTIDELLALPGVGRKTANCVLLYAFDQPAIIVDTYTSSYRITN